MLEMQHFTGKQRKAFYMPGQLPVYRKLNSVVVSFFFFVVVACSQVVAGEQKMRLCICSIVVFFPQPSGP